VKHSGRSHMSTICREIRRVFDLLNLKLVMVLIIWSTLCLDIISAALTGPQDAVVAVGSTTTFTCTCATDSSEPHLAWKYYPVNNDRFRYLNCEHSTAPKCDVTLSNNNRTSSLTIKDVQLSDAGLYKCSECWDTQGDTKAKLSVIGYYIYILRLLVIFYSLIRILNVWMLS